ncbi:MAG: hypothetical protein H6747_12515 [Deltaproteobacteria bacterium]|nr:hypothetical protein [Deltaproteobacteria bacterium]
MRRELPLPNGHLLELPQGAVSHPEPITTSSEVRPSMQQLGAADISLTAGIGMCVVLLGAAIALAVRTWRLRRGTTVIAAPTAEDGPQRAQPSPAEPVSWRLSLGVLIVVVATAQVVHHAWPFYALDMFSYVPTSGSRLIVLQADGTAREPKRFVDYRCDPMPTEYSLPAPGVCGTWTSIEVHDRASFFWILRHHGQPPPGAAQPLLLARRIERFDAEGGRERVDCPISRCVAREAE